ncbi:MAG: hypothetical protein HYY52_07490 [Candidatus Melainabacteria bacterium]|nr:hypothetical protein [Candidatus Melainabacteria bacterium]
MKNRFIHVAWLTFTVYFITVFCGYFNFLLAYFTGRNYFPLRSYLITFSDSQIKNINEIQKGVFNLAGFRAVIETTIPYKIIDDVFYILFSTLIVVLFFIGYKIVEANKIPQLEIIKWSVIFSVLMTLALPSHSSDLFGYIARGGQQTLYSHNPYLQTVSQINEHNTSSLFLNFMWPSQPTTYGPVFVYLTKLIVLLSNNNFFVSFINFKLLNLTVFFLLVLLVVKLNNTKDIYLIAWNPLILIQGLWNCHNDLISGFLIFLGLYLLIKEKMFWSMFCLTFACGIKYIACLIIPILFFSKKGITISLFVGFLCGLILILIFSIDYLFPVSNLSLTALNKIASNVSLVHKSLIATILTCVKYCCNFQIENILKFFFYLCFALFYLYVLLKRRKNIILDSILVLFIFLSFVIAKFHSWYLLNVIVLIPFLNSGRGEATSPLRWLLITLSMSHVYAITFLDQAKILNYVSMTLLPILFVLFKQRRNK